MGCRQTTAQLFSGVGRGPLLIHGAIGAKTAGVWLALKLAM
jgi:hypothetical protein